MRRDKRRLERQIKKEIAILICTAVGIISIGFINAKAYISYKEEENYINLAKHMNEKTEETVIENKKKKDEVKTEKMMKLEELHNQYEDVVGWIEVAETKINYPVVISNDNSYYLNHTYKKEYSERGSIFLDKDTKFDPPSSNFLIYGHRNKSGEMFEDLMKYKEQAFYKTHKIINFTTLKEDMKFEIIAAFNSRVYYQDEKNVFRYYYFVNAENEEEYNEFINHSKTASLYDTGASAKYGDQLITLSTCAYHTENGRFAVVAKKT